MNAVNEKVLSEESTIAEPVYLCIPVTVKGVKGAKVRALFPRVEMDSNVMPLVRDILISSYMDNDGEHDESELEESVEISLD